MSEQHTQGRVTFKEDGDANHWSMLTEDGRWWLSLLANGEQTSARQIANFRRLAACWNACDGIDTDDLDAHSVNIIHKLHDDAAKRVLSERDELLGLLTELMDTELAELACEGSHAPVEDLLGRIQETLTKHKTPATPAAKTS